MQQQPKTPRKPSPNVAGKSVGKRRTDATPQPHASLGREGLSAQDFVSTSF